jgi:hypothetical protein
VKFAGKLDGATRRVWCDDPSVVFSLPDSSGNATVNVAADARAGVHLVRFINSEGATLPIRFAIGPLPLLEEKEPNDDLSNAQNIEKLPLWIQGKLEKAGDIDHFSFTLKKGVSLRLKVDGYSLGSPVDLILHVLDQKGVKLGTLSDGRNLDPEGVFTAPEDGRYTLQIAGFAHPPASDVNFTGSGAIVYQIAVSSGPVVDRVYPAAVSAVGKSIVELRGMGIPANSSAEIDAGQISGIRETVEIFPKGAMAPVSVLRTRHPIVGAQPEGKPLSTPVVVGGRLEGEGAVVPGQRLSHTAGLISAVDIAGAQLTAHRLRAMVLCDCSRSHAADHRRIVAAAHLHHQGHLQLMAGGIHHQTLEMVLSDLPVVEPLHMGISVIQLIGPPPRGLDRQHPENTPIGAGLNVGLNASRCSQLTSCGELAVFNRDSRRRP